MKFFHLLVFAILPYYASADTSATDFQASYNDCLNATQPINNSSVYSCADSTNELVKKEINYLYRKIYEQFSENYPEDASKLERAQKAWLEYRKSQCELAGSHIGSPMFSVCPMNMNIQRARELRELFSE